MPADVLSAGWDRGKPAALDITTYPCHLGGESCQMAGALAAKTCKHCSNGPKCQVLGGTCIPLAMETFGNWGNEAQDVFTRLASHPFQKLPLWLTAYMVIL